MTEMASAGEERQHSCPGRGAATSSWGLSSSNQDGSRLCAASLCAASRPGHEVSLQALQKCSSAPITSRAPDAAQRPSRCDAEPGPMFLKSRWVPALRRVTACRVASGTRDWFAAPRPGRAPLLVGAKPTSRVCCEPARSAGCAGRFPRTVCRNPSRQPSAFVRQFSDAPAGFAAPLRPPASSMRLIYRG
jgi:hypothetical protein